MNSLLFFLLLVFLTHFWEISAIDRRANEEAPTPVVLWHGMGK
jgi:lysophospholipid acyltransferase (LPLAT)-like uncharacterized protein